MAGGVDATTFCPLADEWSEIAWEILTRTGICVSIPTGKRARFQSGRTVPPAPRAGQAWSGSLPSAPGPGGLRRAFEGKEGLETVKAGVEIGTGEDNRNGSTD